MKFPDYIKDPSQIKGTILFGYFRSSSSWRLRNVLNLKKIEYEQVTVHLVKNEQKSPEYLKINPRGVVACLKIDNEYLNETLPTSLYLEEKFP